VLDEILGIDTDLPVTETHGATLVNFALFDLVGKPTVTAPVSFSVSSRLVNGPTDFLDRHCPALAVPTFLARVPARC